MTRPKLALATQVPALGHGGVENLLRELSKGLARDFEIYLIAPDHEEEIRAAALGGIIKDFLSLKDLPNMTATGEGIARWLSARCISMCHFHSTGTYAWGAAHASGGVIPIVSRSGVRCWATNHQVTSPFDANRKHQPLPRRLGGFVKRLPGKTRQLAALEKEILVSRHDREVAGKCFPFSRSRFETVYHSKLDGSAPPPGALKESRVILNVGSICFRKGQDRLAEAFVEVHRDFPDWVLHLVGEKMEPECVARVQEMGDRTFDQNRIVLTGPRADPMDAIESCEIYVQPSLLEGLGLALQEALFAGRPAIGSSVGGIPELIDDEVNGLLVPPGDVGALASALRMLMTDREKRVAMAAKGRSSILEKNMTSQAMTSAYARMYCSGDKGTR